MYQWYSALQFETVLGLIDDCLYQNVYYCSGMFGVLYVHVGLCLRHDSEHKNLTKKYALQSYIS